MNDWRLILKLNGTSKIKCRISFKQNQKMKYNQQKLLLLDIRSLTLTLPILPHLFRCRELAVNWLQEL